MSCRTRCHQSQDGKCLTVEQESSLVPECYRVCPKGLDAQVCKTAEQLHA